MSTRRRQQTLKYIAIQLPEDLHAAVKEKAARDRITLKDLVIEALRVAVEKGGRKAG